MNHHRASRSLPRAIALSLAFIPACGSPDGAGDDSFSSELSVVAGQAYAVTGVQSGKCVEVAGGSTANRAALQIATCNGSTRQQFRFEDMGSGYFRLRNANSGLCVDVDGASTSPGARVIQWTCGTGANQQWRMADVNTSVTQLLARHSGQALDVSGRGTADGTPLLQWTRNASATNQQFRLSASGGGGGTGGTGGTSGTSGSGGSSTGGTGGSSTSGSAGAAAGSGGGPTATGKVWSQCRFHFGTIDSIAKANPSMIPQIDYFTPGWMGLSDTFDQSYVCAEVNGNGPLVNKVPVIVAYVSAFYVKRHHGPLCDCNVSTCGSTNGRANDLCNFGSQYIQQDLAKIVQVYRNYAQGYAACYGTTRPIVFNMEPDWYQYTNSSQTDPMTRAEAASAMGQFAAAIKQYLPNAYISMDISPWVAPNNGSDHGAQWYSSFDMSRFTFINTSGGSTLAANTRIRSSNNMTWGGVSGVTGKPILADTGYGAAGVSAGHDPNWDVAANINARIDNGVIALTQYNPSSNWASTIAAIRGQLKTPKFCP